jgi:plastocyanin
MGRRGREEMRKIISLILMALLIMTGIMIVSCGSSNVTTTAIKPITTLPTITTTGTPMPVDNVEVLIENYEYAPSAITIPPGTNITWKNKDSVKHTVTSRDNVFDSGLFGQNETFSYTFSEPGEYEYYCIPHPYMTGKISVK